MYYHNMQNNITDCGIAVLKTILQQYKLNLPRDFMNDIKISHTEQGLSLNDLSIVLGKQGIQSDAYEMTDIAELKNIRFPAIAIIDNNGMNHYIVIHQFNDKSKELIVSNPAETSLKNISIKEFETIFSGYILCIEDVSQISKKSNKSEDSLYKEVLDKINKIDKIKYSIISIIKWGLPISLLFIMQYLFMYQMENMSYVNIVITTLLFIFIIMAYYCLSQIDIHNKMKLENEIVSKMAMEYLSYEIERIDKEKNSNSVEGIFWNIIISVSGILQKFYLKIDCILILTILITVFGINWIYGLILIGFIICVFVSCFYSRNRIKNRQVEIIGAASGMSSCIQEMTQSSMDLKIYSKTKDVKNFCNQTFARYKKVKENINIEDTQISTIYDVLGYFVMTMGLMTIFLSYLSNAAFSSSKLMIAFYMSVFLTMSFKSTLQRWLEYQKSINAVEYIETILEGKKGKEKQEIQLNIDKIRKLELRNIDMCFEEKEILKNLSFKVESGEIIGIKGENGVGKTTLAKIIMGILEPQIGKIVLNDFVEKNSFVGTNINDYIAFYSSELYVYNNSVKNNIIFNVLNNKQLELKEHNFLNELPLEHLLFMNGINISQGERQKVLLDRCFYFDKDVYILDEPGINLDKKSKESLINQIMSLQETGKIVIIISHDKEILSCCTNVYNMENGSLK